MKSLDLSRLSGSESEILDTASPRSTKAVSCGQMRHRVASIVLLAAMASPLRLASAMPQHTMSRMMGSTKNLAFSLLPSSLPSIRPGQRIQHASVCLEGIFKDFFSFKLSILATEDLVCMHLIIILCRSCEPQDLRTKFT
jgi:hypothetical protein